MRVLELLEEGWAGEWCLKAGPGLSPPLGALGQMGQGPLETLVLHHPPGPDGRTPPPGEQAGAAGATLASTVPGCPQPAL